MYLNSSNLIRITANDRRVLRLPEPKYTKYLVYQWFTPSKRWFMAFINDPKVRIPKNSIKTVRRTQGHCFKSLLWFNKKVQLTYTIINQHKKLIEITKIKTPKNKETPEND